MDRFNNALAQVLFVEGGYSDHPEDKGGKTKYGITEGTYRAWQGEPVNHWPTCITIESITKNEASDIYLHMYWSKIRGYELPPGVSLMVFDSAVHAGPTRAIKWLQKAVGVKSDGILGPKTLQVAHRTNRSSKVHEPILTVNNIAVYRLMMAKNNETFVKGWFRRIIHILAASIEEAVTSAQGKIAPQ